MSEASDPKLPPSSPATGSPASSPRPSYEPPRITRKKTVRHATLFTGGGGPSSVPLVPSG